MSSSAQEQPRASTASSSSQQKSGQGQDMASSSSTSFASYLWPWGSSSDPSSSSSSSSSSASSQSSSSSSSRTRPRPSYEEFRRHEPPQARLIRLRGLFDKLLDKSGESALANGRAKEAWTKSAIRARLGAAGLKPDEAAAVANKLAPSAKDDVGSSSSSSSSTGGSASTSNRGSATPAADKLKQPELPPSAIPQPSYATELLAQCKRSHDPSDAQQSERQRAASQVRKEAVAKSATSPSSSSGASSGKSTLGFGSLPLPLSGRDRAADAARDGEAGWTGSGVWGLTAVSLEHLEDATPSNSSTGNGASAVPETESSRARREGAPEEQVVQLEERERAEREEAEGVRQRRIEWEGFLKYAEEKERELYNIFQDLDKNGDGILDINEIRAALERAGIDLGSVPLEDFTASLASSRSYPSPTVAGLAEGSMYVTFPEFRDYLLLLPRKATMPEIFRFYQVRKAVGLFVEGGVFAELGKGWGKTKRGAAVVNFDGDVSLAGEDRVKTSSSSASSAPGAAGSGAAMAAAAYPSKNGAHAHDAGHSSDGDEHPLSHDARARSADGAQHQDGSEEEEEDQFDPQSALKFLLAGGIAGAVSRTATAPFDRLKVYLITSARQSAVSELAGGGAAKAVADAAAKGAKAAGGGVLGAAGALSAGAGQVAASGGTAAYKGAGLLTQAIVSLYKEGGGLKAFWVGNGLNVIKIFPESAIKFMSYEMSKRMFAKYVDGVTDVREISGSSRFLSGGIGGITSQLAIYPIETLKTRLMSSQKIGGPNDKKLLFKTARDMYQKGGLRLYYRGLTAGLVGVFPYSAIDMSAFEGIKLFYIKYTGKEEPGVLALLAFGSTSGSVGATTVYPLNLIRTRLQAAGTPAHPQTYDGFFDAVRKTYKNEGVVGFYRGLVPTLAKVVPAVSISYVVYEHAVIYQSKRKLGVQ